MTRREFRLIQTIYFFKAFTVGMHGECTVYDADIEK